MQGTGCCPSLPGGGAAPAQHPPTARHCCPEPPGLAVPGAGGGTPCSQHHPAPVLPSLIPLGISLGCGTGWGAQDMAVPRTWGGAAVPPEQPLHSPSAVGSAQVLGVGGEAGALGAQCQAVPSTHSIRHLSPCEVMQGYDIITPPSPSLGWDAAPGAPYHPPQPQKKPQSNAKLTRVYCFTSPPRPYKTRGLKAPRVRGQGGPG